MKKVIIVAGVAVVAAVLIVWGLKVANYVPFEDTAVQEQQAIAFTEAARARVNSEIGRPIEGYEPFMFMEVYPNLTEEDFDGVEALIGRYVYANGKLSYDPMGETELHTAARALSDEGMGTLLSNIHERLGHTEDVAAIEEALGAGAASDDTDEAADVAEFTGEIVCLPHANVEPGQPVTMECAFGLQVDSGLYFGLNFAAMSMMYMPNVGEQVTVTGRLVEPEDTKYDIQGTIWVVSISAQN